MNSIEEHLGAPVGTALDRFIARRQEEFSFASGELSQLLRDIALASKIINREINRAGLAGIEGHANQENVQGEIQQKLDIIANIRFKRALQYGGETCAILSEEEEDPIFTENTMAKYIVAIDPLDGSSNIDVNVSVGTIFSIYRRQSMPGTPITNSELLQPGREQVAAGYILYGSSTMLVYTTGYGVNGFTLEPSLGEYFLSHPNMRISPKGNIYSINDGLYNDLSDEIKGYLTECRNRGYKARYIGSLVADIHRNLLKGGIFMYPGTPSHPRGKLRLMYEGNAVAFLIEQAGGVASDGEGRIMDIGPSKIHERTPLIIGSREMVEELLELINGESK